MTTLSATIRAYPLITFYGSAFAISWLGWIPSLAVSHGVVFFANPFWQAALILPAVGPALAATLAVRLAGEPGGVRQRLQTLFRWHVDLRWYVFSAIVPPLLLLAARAVSHVLPGTIPVTSLPFSSRDVLVFGVISLLANPWEEVGWRGFALTRLQARHHAIVATFIVGALWTAWHAPIFFLTEGRISMATVPFWPWSIDLLARSFLMTWLFNRSGRSVLITSLFHVAINLFGATIGVVSYPALAAVEIVVALGLVLIGGPTLGYKSKT